LGTMMIISEQRRGATSKDAGRMRGCRECASLSSSYQTYIETGVLWNYNKSDDIIGVRQQGLRAKFERHGAHVRSYAISVWLNATMFRR